MSRVLLRTIVMVIVCLGVLSNPALADYKNFGIYLDTNGDGVLNPGDTFVDGFMSWYTHDSAGSSYNYNNHTDPQLSEATDLPGAPWASDYDDYAPADPKTWLPMHEDELHMYMAWSNWDNTSTEGIDNQRTGFALGMIANNYVNSRVSPPPPPIPQASGGYELDIAIRNDGTALPQVTLSDDYLDEFGNTTDGRPPFPGTLDTSALEQELYKTTASDSTYGHYFEGDWDYTADYSTADGGVISGIHNIDHEIDIFPSKIVKSIDADGLVIRIDPQSFDEVDKIVIYDFGYFNSAVDKTGDAPPTGYAGHTDTWAPLGIEIPIIGNIENGYQAFFIASIPEEVPEPSTLLTLLVIGTTVVLSRRRAKN